MRHIISIFGRGHEKMRNINFFIFNNVSHFYCTSSNVVMFLIYTAHSQNVLNVVYRGFKSFS